MNKGMLLILGFVVAPVLRTDAAEISKVLFSLDEQGQTLHDLSSRLPENTILSNVFSAGGEIFVGFDSGNLYESGDLETGAWSHLTFAGFRNQRLISALHKGASNVYVSIYETGIFRRGSTGVWESIQNNLSEKNIHAISELADGSILVAGNTGIFKSADQGKTWRQTLQENWVLDIMQQSGGIVVSSENGILFSADQGENWKLVYHAQDTQYSFLMLNNTLVALKDFGTTLNKPYACLLTSPDNGQTWQQITVEETEVKEIFDAEAFGDKLFFSARKGIYRSTDAGKTWELIQELQNDKQPMRFELVISREKLYALKIWNGC